MREARTTPAVAVAAGAVPVPGLGFEPELEQPVAVGAPGAVADGYRPESVGLRATDWGCCGYS